MFIDFNAVNNIPNALEFISKCENRFDEELERAVKQALNETNISDKVSRCFHDTFKTVMKEEVRSRIVSPFNRMQISVDITDEHGTSSLG